MPEFTTTNPRSKNTVTPREIFFRYIHYLPWIIISVALCLMGAYVKLRYSTTVYSISGRLLVTSQNPYSGGSGEKFDDIFMMQRGDKINDEIEIIKSRAIAARVIKSLGFQMYVYNKGKIRSTVVHPRDMPFDFNILKMDSTRGFSLLLKFLPNDKFQVNESPTVYSYYQVVNLPSVTFRLHSNDRLLNMFASKEFGVSWVAAEQRAAGLAGEVAVARVNDITNILAISYRTENIRLGVDIINQYMKEYQQASLEDKREIAGKTLDFIDDQLDTVIHELGGVERNLQMYRERNSVINPSIQSQLFFNELSEVNKQMAVHEIGSKITDYLTDYLSDFNNRYKVIPSLLGIEEPALLQQVTEFNKLQLERETMLKNIAANNPRMIATETAIEKLRVDMLETLKNVKATHRLAASELDKKNKDANKLINSIPAKEKQLLEVTRQQNILQELYSYLLQKKLETAIASASTISSIKVVDPAIASGVPISPSKKSIYIIAVFFGLAIPAALIFLIEYFNDKIKTRTEIQQITDTPILGEIGHAEESHALVVTKNNRRFLAEQFRVIRSNLQYILPKVEKPILMVTSSFSGEGKSFISTNLGSVMALSEKRTVILEFDIRKPKILKGLGLNERKGLTNYIVSSLRIDEIIYPVPDVENLFVIPCGPVPPNPAEMLLSDKVSQLFEELRERFDTIIIDTAPVGLVSDAVTLGAFADATIYIVRHNYTLKKQIQLIDDLYKNNKLPHLSIIVNDIDARGGYGNYYGYGGYGYGYGYGYGSGYFEEGKKKRGWLSKLKIW